MQYLTTAAPALPMLNLNCGQTRGPPGVTPPQGKSRSSSSLPAPSTGYLFVRRTAVQPDCSVRLPCDLPGDLPVRFLALLVEEVRPSKTASWRPCLPGAGHMGDTARRCHVQLGTKHCTGPSTLCSSSLFSI